MAEKPFVKGIWSFLGLEKAQAKTVKVDPPKVPDTDILQSTTPRSTSFEGQAAVPRPPKPKTEAYLNRRKGRKVHPTASGYLKIIAECILRRGEIAPGDMARELGLPKSTLIYNLNRLLAICKAARNGDPAAKRKYVINEILGGKHVERVGASKYVRYRIVQAPPQGQESSN